MILTMGRLSNPPKIQLSWNSHAIEILGRFSILRLQIQTCIGETRYLMLWESSTSSCCYCGSCVRVLAPLLKLPLPHSRSSRRHACAMFSDSLETDDFKHDARLLLMDGPIMCLSAHTSHAPSLSLSLSLLA